MTSCQWAPKRNPGFGLLRQSFPAWASRPTRETAILVAASSPVMGLCRLPAGFFDQLPESLQPNRCSSTLILARGDQEDEDDVTGALQCLGHKPATRLRGPFASLPLYRLHVGLHPQGAISRITLDG